MYNELEDLVNGQLLSYIQKSLLFNQKLDELSNNVGDKTEINALSKAIAGIFNVSEIFAPSTSLTNRLSRVAPNLAKLLTRECDMKDVDVFCIVASMKPNTRTKLKTLKWPSNATFI